MENSGKNNLKGVGSSYFGCRGWNRRKYSGSLIQPLSLNSTFESTITHHHNVYQKESRYKSFSDIFYQPASCVRFPDDMFVVSRVLLNGGSSHLFSRILSGGSPHCDRSGGGVDKLNQARPNSTTSGSEIADCSIYGIVACRSLWDRQACDAN